MNINKHRMRMFGIILSIVSSIKYAIRNALDSYENSINTNYYWDTCLTN